MLTEQELKGNWNELKGRVQQKWGQVSENDLEEVKGNFNRLVAVIHHRTGEAREAIEEFVEDAVRDGASMAEQIQETAQAYAEQAGESAQELYEQASECIADGYGCVQDTVRRRPAESLAVTFGAGIVAGALLGILLKSRS